VPEFDWLAFHPRFEDHQEDAGRRVVTCDEAEEAWWGERKIARNRTRGRAPYLMIGMTREPRKITVVLFGTDLDDTWLAYTAWTWKESDQ
jgi:hypothetical protein